MVTEVENDLAEIWPTLKKILRFTRKVDNFLVDFSMELARDGAWRFAKKVAITPEDQLANLIKERDVKVTKNADIITSPGLIATIILKIIRLGERGTVIDKIEDLTN